jgi:hypothetical protein
MRLTILFLLTAAAATACGGGNDDNGADSPVAAPPPAGTPSPSPGPTPTPPASACSIPTAGQPRTVSQPATVVGTGTPASCTSDAVVAAVANGGVVTFNCGPDPVTIAMTATARVFNNKPDLVLDGGGKVTLSGGGARRILYQNTCDPALVWMSTRCDIDDAPKTTLQNIAFVDGNSSGQGYGIAEVYGGGAVFARGGRLSIINASFERNRCESTGPDLGGAAVRALEMSRASPVYVVGSTFKDNVCSNGGGLSSIATSWSVINSAFDGNQAIGVGANPQRAGTPGGGNGGAIYNDGNAFDLSVCGSSFTNNRANEGGGAIIYVSNDRSGTMSLTDSAFSANPSAGFETSGLPGMFVLAAPGQPVVTRTTLAP